MRALLMALVLVAGCSSTDAQRALDGPGFNDTFWEHWGDGYAELAGYELTFPRYGAFRSGTAVLIFVTETFSMADRVKADPGEHPPRDEIPVMKVNVVQDFPTGIYDYNMMTSSFVALVPQQGRPAGYPLKVSFSSQEWCGNVYSQLLFDDERLRGQLHSYFDGEADQTYMLEYPENGISADALWFWARQLAAPTLRPGESQELPVLGSLAMSRLAHEPLRWHSARLSRADTPTSLSVPAGDFEVEAYTAALENGPTYTFHVEVAAPHRIVRWETSTGERGDLKGSDRLKYWELHDPGGRALLSNLGL